jgi:transposase
MSIPTEFVDTIPEETVRIARASFPKGCLLMTIRDSLGQIFTNEDLAQLYSNLGQPGYSPWRLAIVLIFQFIEGLSDRKAALCVASRIDLKYALALPIDDPGFDFSILSEFHQRLIDTKMTDFVLNRLVKLCQNLGFIKENSKQRTDSTHVLAKIRKLNRLTLAGG